MSNKQEPRRRDFNATRPQAKRLQPVVRNLGIRNIKKPKADK